MSPIKLTHELNEHNYLNVDALILQIISFFPSLHVYIKSPGKLYIKKKFIGLCWVLVVARGVLLVVDSLVVAPWLSCSAAGGFLVPWSGIEAMSPALQGRFLTPGPLGKSPNCTFLRQGATSYLWISTDLVESFLYSCARYLFTEEEGHERILFFMWKTDRLKLKISFLSKSNFSFSHRGNKRRYLIQKQVSHTA